MTFWPFIVSHGTAPLAVAPISSRIPALPVAAYEPW